MSIPVLAGYESCLYFSMLNFNSNPVSSGTQLVYHKLFSESTAKSPVNEFGIGATILEYVISSVFCDKSKKVILCPVKSFTIIFEPLIASFWGNEPSSEAGYCIGVYSSLMVSKRQILSKLPSVYHIAPSDE